MTYPCPRCNRDDGYPICAGDERCQRTDRMRAQTLMANGLTEAETAATASVAGLIGARQSAPADIVSKLRSLKVLLGTDSPEVRGWAPAVQQQAQKVVNEAIAALAAPTGPKGLTANQHFALREAHAIGASDAYFNAWPTHDNDAGRMLFERGFVRGFDCGVALPPA